MKRKILILLLFLAPSLAVYAHDFAVAIEGQQVYFNIIDKKNRVVELTYPGSIAEKKPIEFRGILTLPAKVEWNDTTYQIQSIAPKTFSGSRNIEGIVLPSGIKSIGAFAFEGCTSLSKVFFPGNPVTLGQGVFFGCNKISEVSFGSDWTEVDLQIFRWSTSLKQISIPARVTRIRNLKSLRFLTSIQVDVNNSHFKSYGGVLYNADATVLYGCPRAYEGTLSIAETTKTITSGALIDCPHIKLLILPASVQSMPFMETSIKGLETIVFKGTEPLATALKDNKDVFLIYTANPNMMVVVNKQYKKEFLNAVIAEPGDYTEKGTGKVIHVNEENLPIKSNIQFVKDFNEYE